MDERLIEQKEVDPFQIEKVTLEEELQLISFHSRRISALAKHFNMPSQVRATAISFLRKFYLVNSVMEYHPKLILLTCLFLAAKSENYFISIHTFCKRIPKTTPESILSLEFEILQSLKFTLLTHHPFRPLYGFFFDIQEVLKDDYSSKELGTIYDEARKLVDETLISDAVYHFTPPQIALACFKQINNELVLKYLKKKFDSETKPETIKEEEEVKEEPNEGKEISLHDQILETIEQCQEVIKKAQNPTKEEATIIDRKVQYCLNPVLIMKRRRDDNIEDSNKKQKTDENSTPTPQP